MNLVASFGCHGQGDPKCGCSPAILSQGYLLKSDPNIKRKSANMKNKMTIAPCLVLFLAAALPVWGQDQTEGRKLYLTYCSSCHGEKGKGDGPAASSLTVKPADHTNGSVMNQFADKFLTEIIAKGGSAVGKSALMPAWGSQLKDKQLRDLVAYIRSIADPPYKAAGK